MVECLPDYIIDRILTSGISTTNVEDRIVRQSNPKGNFSIKDKDVPLLEVGLIMLGNRLSRQRLESFPGSSFLTALIR